jgi:hypothetical protein
MRRADAILAMQAVANLFAVDVRASSHAFADPAELQRRAIYNLSPINGGAGAQVYVY